MSGAAENDDIIQQAQKRLAELHAEALRTKASCKVTIEVTYQKGIPQQVQDERRRYGR
jgi:hypothetical protein